MRRAYRLLFLWLTLAGGVQAAPDLTAPGTVILLRHAHAPGTGDPAGFDLADGRTQRNLDERGRAQARDLGRRLRSAGLGNAPVFTSEWHRCRETAALLGLGPVEILPALNSFFARPDDRERLMAALRGWLRDRPPESAPAVLVTHQVNITALTGHHPAAGGGVVLRLDGTENPRRVGLLPAEDGR
jgi:broad specificity phosphatase PhoE